MIVSEHQEIQNMPKSKKSVDDKVWKTEDALAMACSIYRQKGYTSTSTVISSESTNEKRWTNKEHLTYQLMPELASHTYLSQFEVTEKDQEQAAAIINHFRRLSFGVIGDNLNDYMKRVFAVTQNSMLSFNDLGVLASVPQVYDREIQAKEIKTQIKNAKEEYLGEVGQSIIINVKYLSVKYLPHINAYAHECLADSGHLISFLNKISLGQQGQCQKVKGRVKRHTLNWSSKLPETQINYVKIVDNILVWQ